MNSSDKLNLTFRSDEVSIYEILKTNNENKTKLRRFITSTSQSRRITNDPLCLGCEYTELLEDACSLVLEGIYPILDKEMKEVFSEKNTSVLHILRGGLNFGLRSALRRAYGWNLHRATYLSAQRKRKEDNPEDWLITETNYQKPSLSDKSVVVFGDVVATGTSLDYSLKEIIKMAKEEKKEISSFIFFTIGGIRSEEIMLSIENEAKALFPSYVGSIVVYLEGRFKVPDLSTTLTIKETGTDLIRTDSLLSEEFTNSQLENPLYPLERCTIYDAGSRSFDYSEYLHDVLHYWENVHELSLNGMTYESYLKERFPEILPLYKSHRKENFLELDLRKISKEQLDRIKNI